MNVAGLPYLNDQISDMLSQTEQVMLVASEFMRDKTIPLEDRWNVYLRVEKFLPIQSYFGEAIRELTEDVYDEFFPDGKGCRWNSNIDEGLLENGEYVMEQKVAAIEAGLNFVPDKYDARALEMFAKRDAWREAVLQEQQGLIVFDW